MSVEAPAVAVPLPLEVAPPPVTPEERFASHVEWVREQGDAYDSRRTLWQLPLAKLGAVAGVAGVTMTTAGEALLSGVETAAYGGMVGLAAYGIVRYREAAVAKRAARRQDVPTQQALDQRYELLRVPGEGKDPAKVVLFWHGTMENAGTKPRTEPESLQEMARLAKKYGVSSIAMRPYVALRATVAFTKPLPGVSMHQWLDDKKNLHVHGRADSAQVVEADPDFWLEHAKNDTSPEQERGIDLLIGKIGALEPLHGAPRIAREHPGKDEATKAWKRDRLLASLKVGLERQLSDVESTAPADRHNGTFLRHEKQSTFATIIGEEVEIHVDGRLVERKPLALALGLDDVRLQLLLESTDPRFGQERLQALEFVLYRTLHRRDEVYRQQETVMREDRQYTRPSSPWPFQMEVAVKAGKPPGYIGTETTSTYVQSLLRSGAALASWALASAVLGGATVGADAVYHHREVQAVQQLAHERGVDPSQITEQQARQRVNGWSGLNAAWSGWMDIRQAIHPSFGSASDPEGDKTYGDPNAVGDGVESIGNFVDPYPHNVWNLNAHNMDPSGYWIADTSDILLARGCNPNCNTVDFMFDMSGVDQKVNYEVATMPATIDELHLGKPWTQVTGTVFAKNFISGKNSLYLPLPILQGNEVFAVNFNGKPIPIVARKDGTFAIRLDNPNEQLKGGSGTVEYWIQPNSNAQHPHVMSERSVLQGIDPSRQKIDAAFSQFIPGYAAAGKDENKKRQAVYDYLQNDFLYSTTPISESERKHITSWSTFVQQVLERKLANCNMASTLMVMADPRLAAAVGFYNAPGAGSNALQTGEAHMVDISQDAILDPTPSGVFQLNKPGSDNKEPVPLTPWLVLAGALQLAGVSLLARSEIVKLAHGHKIKAAVRAADRAVAELEATDTFALHTAANIYDQAQWGPGQVAPLMSVATLADHQTRTQTREQAYARVMRPEFLAPAALKHMRAQDWHTDTAQHIHRLANRAAARPPYHRRRK